MRCCKSFPPDVLLHDAEKAVPNWLAEEEAKRIGLSWNDLITETEHFKFKKKKYQTEFLVLLPAPNYSFKQAEADAGDEMRFAFCGRPD